MSWVVGIDGCPRGWLAAGQALPGGPVKFAILSRLDQLDDFFPGWRMVGIDMPIGLGDDARRQADIEARRFVGPRASSVFPALIRPVLSCRSYDEGCNLSLLLAGFKFSKQVWMLKERIIEVDQFLDDSKNRERVFEVHPEVSFAVMNFGVMPYKKKSPEGQAHRELLLSQHFQGAYESARDVFMVSHAANDDILDSLAALWSAWRILEGRARFFPEEPIQYDSAGRRMVIAA